jgi:hypoxanthine phosphoribosyltransferase
MDLALSFLVGVLASVAAAYLVILRQRTRFRLGFRSIMANIGVLLSRMEAENYTPDLIVTIDRNSGVVGSIVAGHIGLTSVVSLATQNSRGSDGTRTIQLDPAFEPALAGLAGRNVLVLICCNDSGVSLEYIVTRLRTSATPPAEVRTAALYTSVSPALKPKYFAVEVGQDTKVSMNQIVSRLPWMTNGWKHVFGNERLAP